MNILSVYFKLSFGFLTLDFSDLLELGKIPSLDEREGFWFVSMGVSEENLHLGMWHLVKALG